MNLDPETFLNPYVLVYLVIVVVGQWAHALWLKKKRNRIGARRAALGLPSDILIDHSERLSDRKQEAVAQSAILIGTIVVTPFLLIGIAGLAGSQGTAKNGLALVFVVLLLWVLINGTDVSKAFLGGLAFKTMAAFKAPFQVGDRVTLRGIGGKVIGFDTFYVTLQTSNDNRVSIPTAGLLSEILNSANAGKRASLCVMDFYLAPFVSATDRQGAEDAIWNAIQSSVYFDSSLPMQIYLRQNPDSIQLSAKAYVASTYNEPLFISDVTRAFLDFAAENRIALASPAWSSDVGAVAEASK